MPETADAAPRRWRKPLLIAGALLLLIVGGGTVALLSAYPPERIAALVAEQVHAKTGRDFAIRGKLTYRVLPRIAVVAEGLALANAPWGSRKDMLRVERAAFELELWPLLQGRVRIGSVELDGVDLLLETDRQGAGNWVLSAPNTGSAPSPADPKAAPQSFELDAARLRKVAVTYRDGATVHQLALESFDLDRNAGGHQVDAEWVLRQQRWRASGQMARLDALIANDVEWPFALTLTSDGARVVAKGRLLPGEASRSARLEFDVKVDKAAALVPWTADASAVPLPIEAKSTLDVSAKALRADPLQVSLAGQTLAGRVTLTQGEPWQLDASLKAGKLDLTRAWPKRETSGAQSAAAGGQRQLFGDERLPIATLPDVRAKVALRIDQLLLAGAPPLSAVIANVDLVPSALKLEPLSFDVAGGAVHGSVVLNAGTTPRLNVQIAATNLSAEALARAMGSNHVGGGRLQLQTALAMTGSTPHALAASASGDLLLSAKDMTLAEGALPIGPNLLPRLLQIFHPQRGAAKVTTVECAVARLPLRNGVAAVDRSIAVETSDLTFSASGRIDLRDQTMELAFRPNTRSLLGVNPVQLASLVVAKGPLLDPKLTLDAKGAANMALSIGAAAVSGGLSLLGKNLVNQAGDPHPCIYAATGVAAKAPAKPAETTTTPGGKASAGKPDELQKLLRGIFK